MQKTVVHTARYANLLAQSTKRESPKRESTTPQLYLV